MTGHKLNRDKMQDTYLRQRAIGLCNSKQTTWKHVHRVRPKDNNIILINYSVL